MLTIEELKERLKDWDEVDLLDALGITSDLIVERFHDLIEDKYDTLTEEEEEEEDEFADKLSASDCY